MLSTINSKIQLPQCTVNSERSLVSRNFLDFASRVDGFARRNLSYEKGTATKLKLSSQLVNFPRVKIVHHNPENGRARLYQGQSVFCKICAAKYCSPDIFCTVQFCTHPIIRAKSWRMCAEFHPCAFRLSLKNAWVGARAVWKEALRNLQELSLFS